MSEPIHEYGDGACDVRVSRGKYVCDGNGHLFLIAPHAQPKDGQRYATADDIRAARDAEVARKAAESPAPAEAPAPVVMPIERAIAIAEEMSAWTDDSAKD